MAKQNNNGAARGRGRPSSYDPLYAYELVAYFRRAWRAVEDLERVATRDGVRYVQRPVPLPTISGFAASIRVSRETLWRWGEAHPKFKDALERARTMQEDLAVRMGLAGAYPASLVALVLKNCAGWKDKSDVEFSGGVRLVFDAQDASS